MPCLGLGNARQSHHGEGNQACLWEPAGDFLIQGLHKSKRPKNVATFVSPWVAVFMLKEYGPRKLNICLKNYPKSEQLVQTQSREEEPGHWEARLPFLSALKAFSMASAHLKGSSQAGVEMPTEEKPLSHSRPGGPPVLDQATLLSSSKNPASVHSILLLQITSAGAWESQSPSSVPQFPHSWDKAYCAFLAALGSAGWLLQRLVNTLVTSHSEEQGHTLLQSALPSRDQPVSPVHTATILPILAEGQG